MTPLDALYRCQRAWERTQPQLFMELWPDAGLDAAQTSPPLRCVEPAARFASRGGLTAGAEPRRDHIGADGNPSPVASPPVSPPRSGGSAPSTTTGRHAIPAEEARAAQRRSF